MRAVWFIEYKTCSRPCWIAKLNVDRHSYGVTYNPDFARDFLNKEDAGDEILRLGLSSNAWSPVERIVE